MNLAQFGQVSLVWVKGADLWVGKVAIDMQAVIGCDMSAAGADMQCVDPFNRCDQDLCCDMCMVFHCGGRFKSELLHNDLDASSLFFSSAAEALG